MKSSCGSCRFWNSVQYNIGECRRFPPRVTPRDHRNGDELAWTLTRKEDWCGECESDADLEPRIIRKRSIDEFPVGPTAEPTKALLSVKEAARYIGMSAVFLSRSRLQRVGTPGPPFIKFGRNVKYRRQDLDNWIAAQRFDFFEP